MGPPAADSDGDAVVDHDRIRALVYSGLTAEFASIKDGKPGLYPITPLYDEDHNLLVVSSPPAFAGKVERVAENPKVGLLLHDDGGEFLVIGKATLRDANPTANAEYVADCMLSEPPSDRRAVHEEAINSLDSLLGRWLMGWYAERVVALIEPQSIEQVGDGTTAERIDAWPAAGMDDREAGRHERALVAIVGDDGYPTIRPLTEVRTDGHAATLAPSPTPTPADGQPACLLCHWTDEGLDSLGQRVVRGRFRTSDGACRFVHGSHFDMRRDGHLDTVRFIVRGKRRARAYARE